MGSPEFLLPMCFARIGTISGQRTVLWDRPGSCCYCVFHALGEYQASALLLQERTNSDFYFVLSAVVQYPPSEYFLRIAHSNVGYCFYSFWAVAGSQAASAGWPESGLLLILYTHQDNVRIANRVCGDDPTHVLYHALHALR